MRGQVFGVQWSEALSKGWVRNAADAAQHLKLKPMDLAARFDELKRGVDQVKQIQKRKRRSEESEEQQMWWAHSIVW